MSIRITNPTVQQNLEQEERQSFTSEVGVVLGMPKHQCRFHGICRIDDGGLQGESETQCMGERVKGLLRQNHPNYCQLLIVKGQLSAELERYHFHRPSLICESPLLVGRLLGRVNDRALSIKPGAYRITEYGGYFGVTFSLTNRM